MICSPTTAMIKNNSTTTTNVVVITTTIAIINVVTSVLGISLIVDSGIVIVTTKLQFLVNNYYPILLIDLCYIGSSYDLPHQYFSYR